MTGRDPEQLPCTAFRPDHNGECLGCDEWADAHTPEALAAGEALARRRPHAKLAADTWRLVRALLPNVVYDDEYGAAATNLIEIACDSAVAAERHTSRAERRSG